MIMLINPALEIIGYSDIKRSVFLIRHNIKIVSFHRTLLQNEPISFFAEFILRVSERIRMARMRFFASLRMTKPNNFQFLQEITPPARR